MIIHTTFDLLRRNNACKDGYSKLAKHLGGVVKYGRATPISLLTILDSNGIFDALWCLRATMEPFEQIKLTVNLIVVDIDESVLHHLESACLRDKRTREDSDYARNKISIADLFKTRSAAAAAYAACDAAYDAADAACDAADAADAGCNAGGVAGSSGGGAGCSAGAARNKFRARLSEIVRGYLEEDE